MKHRNHRWLWLILAVAILLRVGVAFYLGDVVDAPPLLTDQRSYHFLAVRLLEGHCYSFERAWYPFTPADTPTAHWSFLYPLFVAAVYAVFGVHPLAARVVQAVLGGLLLPWMVYRLTRTVFRPLGDERGNRLLPLIAAAIAAIYIYFVLYAATLMTETFYTVILLWSLDEGVKLGEHLRQHRHIPFILPLRLGLSLGLGTLLRQSILPWIPVFFLYLLWQAWRARRLKETVRSLVFAGLILAICILPWTYRNYRVYNQFLLLNSNTGFAMYSAQHPMHGTHFREFDPAPLPQGLTGNEAQMDRILMRAGIQFVLDDLGRYLLLSLSRVRAFFEFWPTPDTTLLHNVGRTGSFGLFLPFILYGLYLSSRRQLSAVVPLNEPSEHRALHFELFYLFIVFYTVLHVLTWAMVRYRLPVDAVLLPFAALAFYDLYERGRRWLAARTKVGERQVAG